MLTSYRLFFGRGKGRGATLYGTYNLSSLTRDLTLTLYVGNTDS